MEKEYTLAKAFDELATTFSESGLSEDNFISIQSPLNYINHKLSSGFNVNQVFILAALLRNPDKNMTTEDFANFAKVSVLRILDMQKDIDALVSEGWLYCIKNPDISNYKQTFALPLGIFQAIRYDKWEGLSYDDWDTEDVLKACKKYLDACDNNDLDYTIMVKIIKELLSNTKHLVISQKLLELDICDGELMLLIRCLELFVIDSDYTVTSYQYDDILPMGCQKGIIKNFKSKSGKLYHSGLLEPTDSDCDEFSLTAKAKKELLCEVDGDIDSENSDNDDFKDSRDSNDVNEGIPNKAMFYNAQEERQIKDLHKILSLENFETVKNRMKSLGMRPGFACLFYGSPGTGKTETVLQLAKQTGREIIQVNLATVRNCFFGESEKNVQQIFDDYKEKLDDSENCPILLFNEADGIFGKRNTGVKGAADQTENTIQNIILQNMETFEGILIATTNLTGNLDKAFERRFLYKIEFNRPSVKVRKSIWRSLMPELSDSDAETLAKKYDMSGGQIENVARKHLVASILNDGNLTLEEIIALCDSEVLKQGSTREGTSFSKLSQSKVV